MSKEQHENKTVSTYEEALVAGYYGQVQSAVPNIFHAAGSEDMRNEVYGALPEGFNAEAKDGPNVVDASKLPATLLGQNVNAPTGTDDAKKSEGAK